MTFTKRENTRKDKPPFRINQQGWKRAAYDDHGTAGLAVSPTEEIKCGSLFQILRSKASPDPSHLVPLSLAPQGVEPALGLLLEQVSRSSEVLQEQEAV